MVTTAPLSEDLARSLIPKNYCVEDCNYLLDLLPPDRRQPVCCTAVAWVYGARDPDDVERLIMPKLLKTLPAATGGENRLPLDRQLPC
ncbi:oxidoreductase [Klebsiella michiganensis]|nr:oxidoreductase [Klebsiella michiganensis]